MDVLLKAGALVYDDSKEWVINDIFIPSSHSSRKNRYDVRVKHSTIGPLPRGKLGAPPSSFGTSWQQSDYEFLSVMICQKPIVVLTDMLGPDGGCTMSLELLTPHLPANCTRVGPVGAELTDADDVGSVAD